MSTIWKIGIPRHENLVIIHEQDPANNVLIGHYSHSDNTWYVLHQEKNNGNSTEKQWNLFPIEGIDKWMELQDIDSLVQDLKNIQKEIKIMIDETIKKIPK